MDDVGAGRRSITLDRVPIRTWLLEELFAHVPRTDEGRPVLRSWSAAHASFADGVDFDNAIFRDRASFAGATFAGIARFEHVDFEGRADFTGSTFERLVTFEQAEFRRSVSFEEAEFGGDVSLRWALFRTPQRIKLATPGRLDLNWARFQDTTVLDLDADLITAERCQFQEQATIRLSRGDLFAAQTDFGGSGTLITARDHDLEIPPRILSLRNMAATNLVIGELDLRTCLFGGAYRLERVTIDATARLPTAPPRWWMTVRSTIADEHLLRSRLKQRGWTPLAPEVAWPARVKLGEVSDRALLQAVRSSYRGLRKAREDAGDAPSAADFYYGEMEMRRLQLHPRFQENPGATARLQRLGERGLLSLYWAVSGYGTRAWRAIATLVVAVLAAAAILQGAGFATGSGYLESTRIAAGWTTALLRTDDSSLFLTETGEWIRIVLRVVGPLLIGLTLLSLRARVKRYTH